MVSSSAGVFFHTPQNRLGDPLYAASVGQKIAYAKAHNYSFYLSTDARAVIDPEWLKIPDALVEVTSDVQKMAGAILKLFASKMKFSDQLREQLQTGADIFKTRKPAKGVGAVRAATTDPKLPVYLKQSLWYVLETVNLPNGNWDQNFGVLEGKDLSAAYMLFFYISCFRYMGKSFHHA